MHTPSFVRTLVAAAFVLAASAACSSSSTSSPASVCVAGVTQSCLCVGGASGVQICKDDGSGFGACDCGGDSGPKDATVDSSSTDAADGALDDTHPSETNTADTSADTSTDVTTDVGTDGVTDSATRKFSGATAATWETLTGGRNGPNGFSDYSPAGSSFFFAEYAGGPVSMERYNVASDSWTTVIHNPVGVENYKSPAWVGSYLYESNGSMYRYAIASDSWTSVATSLPATAFSMHAHDDGGLVYAMTTDGTNRILVFDTVTHLASYVAGPTGTIYIPRLAWDSASSALYIAPSYDRSYLWSYAPATGAVTARASMPDTMMNTTFCSDRSGHLYADGNVGSCGPSTPSMWQYDVATDTWKKIPDLPFSHGCNGACTVTDDGWLFVSDGGGNLARLKLL